MLPPMTDGLKKAHARVKETPLLNFLFVCVGSAVVYSQYPEFLEDPAYEGN